ncbi:cysteine desulfurase [Microcella putealis]|uniref:Cysteine desulfurase n=1 Tax=Microcella putealis TaxID=337005 RepID=A0A4Q7LZF9_9MICO|nr:SufS family cysteine desulfurase [Microcella putealis]RZS59692.1 cysteine desulfurase [Microcella putealis]TQM26805.1 cysteine desulfurase [Microcella putealis]
MTLSPAPYAGGVTEAAPFSSAELEHIRAQFPILRRDLHGHPLLYLDSAATAQKPSRVIEAEATFYREANAAVHRGAHTLAGEATELYEDARGTVARFLAVNDDEVIFTSNATEGLNLIAYAIGNASLGRGGAAAAPYALREGDEIVVTELEHHANLIPWQELAARTGATLRFIPVDDSGAIDVDAATGVIGARTRILAVSHVSNVTGAHSPLETLVPLARAAGALVVLDACQSAPHLPLRPRELDVDVAVFSGHKLYGPTGIGVLYGRAELLNALPPFLTGGSMITTVTMEGAEYLPAPQRFEPGTPRIAQAIGLAEAIRFVDELGFDRIAATEHQLGARLLAGLAELPGIRVLGAGIDAPRVALASVVVDGVHAHDAGQVLDNVGIAARVGHHCAQPLHRRLGVTASLRVSAGVHTTADEIDQAVAAIAGVRHFFGLTGENA